MIKRFTVFFLIIISCTALYATSASVTVGYGALNGNRVYLDDSSSYTALCASGLETGIILDTEVYRDFSIEGYFAYLFALRGGESSYESAGPSPEKIEEGRKYTDYKAGLGLQYKLGLFSVSGGIDFAGISNHDFVSGKQIRGRKVTSFGVFLRGAVNYPINSRLSAFADVLGCFNFTGWIREFDVSEQKWVNSFDRASDVNLLSAFGRLGLKVSF